MSKHLSKHQKRSPHVAAPTTCASASTESQPRVFRWYWLTMPLIILVYGLLYCEFGEILALNYGAGWDGVSYTQFALAPTEQLQTDAYRSQRILPALIVRTIAESAQQYSSAPKSYFGEWFQRWFFSGETRFVKMVSDIRPRARQGDSTPVRLRLPLIEVADVQSGKHSVTVEPIIVYWFVLYSLVVMVICGGLWAAISTTLQLSASARWLGFIGLFGNFAFLKMSLFYPTLTDLSALCISLLALLGYCSRRNWLVLAAGALGMVIWPTAFVIAAILFLFPRSLPIPTAATLSSAQEASFSSIQSFLPTQFLRTTSGRIAAFMTLCAFALAVWYVYLAPVRFPLVESPEGMITLVGLGAFALMFFAALRPLLHMMIEQPQTGQASTTQVGKGQALINQSLLGRCQALLKERAVLLPLLTRLLILSMLGAVGWFARQSIINPNLAVPLNLAQFIGGSFSLAVTKPFLTIVADVAYFGPIILLVVFSYQRIVSYIDRLGLGFVLVFSITVLLGCVMTESRQLINLFPVVVIAVAMFAEERWFSLPMLTVIALASVGFAKLWIPLNFAGMQQYVMQGGAYSQFPIQRYFMNHGPWMTWESYGYIGAGVLICAALMLVLLRFSRHSSPVQS